MADPYSFDDDDYYDDDEDDHEDALHDCGQTGSVRGCLLAGTEYCDFECPFRDMDLSDDTDDGSDLFTEFA